MGGSERWTAAGERSQGDAGQGVIPLYGGGVGGQGARVRPPGSRGGDDHTDYYSVDHEKISHFHVPGDSKWLYLNKRIFWMQNILSCTFAASRGMKWKMFLTRTLQRGIRKENTFVTQRFFRVP
jgi:hypothetical protein